jgi:hypothetical protein
MNLKGKYLVIHTTDGGPALSHDKPLTKKEAQEVINELLQETYMKEYHILVLKDGITPVRFKFSVAIDFE